MQTTTDQVTDQASDVFPLTGGQAKGGISGTLIGAGVGIVVGAILALLPLFEASVGTRFAILGGICLLGFSLIGALLGGFFGPDASGETASQPGDGPRTNAERRSGHAA